MDERIFLERYRLEANDDGSMHEMGRSGLAINYKAIDEQNDAPVLLQLVPLATLGAQREEFEQRARAAAQIRHINVASVLAVGIEREYLVLVSEYLEGESADGWIVTHGAMQPDAVLRVGIQVLRAIAAAAFYRLTHAAIQPSNIMIVPGQTEDGGWPAVKLIGLGLTGAELHSSGEEVQRTLPASAPEFASPEQLLGREIDFRSEVYSLGATMFFLLTGAVPLGVTAMKARLRLRRLPELRRAPRALRNVLTWMLREDPKNRPQDPVALENAMREALIKVDRQLALRRKIGLPLGGVIRKRARERATPLRQVIYGALAVALLMGVATALGAYFFPTVIPIWHRSAEIGVPVGVPENTSPPVQPPKAEQREQPVATKVVQNSAPVPPALPAATAPPEETDKIAAASAAPAATASAPSATPPVIASAGSASSSESAPSTQNPAAASAQAAPPAPANPQPPPAEGPETQPSSTSESNNADAADASASSESSVRTTKRSTSKTRRSRTVKRALPADNDADDGAQQYGRHSLRARVVGTTGDGRIMLRLPSGRVVFVTPRNTDDDLPSLPRRRVIERPYMVAPPPQYPSDYFPND